MTKTIKFNLIVDGKPIRNLDELRENFNIEDVLAFYRNGLLSRWLESRDLTEEFSELKTISEDDVEAGRDRERFEAMLRGFDRPIWV
ncbi:hypothetical protein [Aeromonas sp. Y293-4]|uniref:hypothetical protein n=1 Tax=Aeromonas sp. Y293-4 TaxID=2990504 RepID=UPI0022E93861|nr:hypothetical protein [Aeromonas sp. Y293-4]